mgnify:CR=1
MIDNKTLVKNQRMLTPRKWCPESGSMPLLGKLN